uniref:DZIP3-like HEPN domain-containing protein n=1 Tax=Magallana gigas TaxID=29159 RepID=A0A8W8JUB0_MAGGI
MEELKHVTVLFKTSIVEHFGEALLKSLCNLNSWDDNQNLDISLVYNLLRNVCKNVTPPRRGWGYEPSDADVSLGADIERIRLMWNRYCDEATECLYLREIFVRMVNRYGNISDDVKLQDTDKKKILSFELNPECQIEDRLVLTKAIKSVLEILEREHIVVVIGALGTGKSTCLKYIESHYRRNQWTVSRKETSITNLALNVDGIKKLFCCDNLFGVYNRGNFAETDEIIKVLENIEQKVNHELKVVFAIHDHVYEELQKIHRIRVFQNKRVVVDFNELSDAEMLLILNDQRDYGHCANDPKCWFRNVDFELVKNTLQENPGKLGDPILTLLYSNRHDIFTKREATRNIVRELCTIFQNMLEDTPDLFNVLMYVMFVKTHNLDKNVEEWASELGGLNSITVKKNVGQLDAFLFVEADGSRIEIKHELLSFALFKCCASSMKYVFLLLKHCRFEMIEEIIRPDSTTNPGEFCVILEKEMYDRLSSRILEEDLFEQLKEHPLLKEKSLFRYKLYSMSSDNGRKIRVVKK